jgi:outer membrane receptor protein involved in Fe transport
MFIVDSGEDCAVNAGNTKEMFVLLILSAWIPAAAPVDATVVSAQTGIANLAAQEKTAVSTGDKAYPNQLTGTVVDASGAVIVGAAIGVRALNGAAQRSVLSDRNGSFMISGLAAGIYRLIVSSPGFEAREVLVTIGADGALAPQRICLTVGSVSATVNVRGREDELIGIADSGTQGTVSATEIQDRPILRSGEVLETVPGLIITQHAGGGKANQYFLRGFNLDHGTDIANFIDDMPLNLPSHAHGEGYSDMNIVIPEFVQRVNFEKGPYYANVGNFGAAASTHMEFFRILPHNFIKIEGGDSGYGRFVFGKSRKLGVGSLLYGGEIYHDNGPWSTHEDNFYKYNGISTYSQGEAAHGFSITARAYRGTWHSSDQVPVDAVPMVGYFGALNPTDGGESQRHSLQGEWHRQSANSLTKIAGYGFYYDLNLFSDFTYYLDDPMKGDQFEQQDRRWVAGLDARHTILSRWFGRKVENTMGLQLRNDWVHNGLFRTENRLRADKFDINACNDEPTINGVPVVECATSTNQNPVGAVLPKYTDLNRFTDTLAGVYAENKVQWTDKFRSVLAVRGDDAKYVVTSLTPAYISSLASAPVNFALLNSGSATKFLPQPKLSLVFGPWSNIEFYAQGGFSYHSNDARGATQHEEPISPDYPFPTSNTPISPLVQLKGGEFGARAEAVSHLQSTLSLWYLRSNSELQQDGDTGGTVASEQSSNRYGTEWANYYTPSEHIILDLDMADSRAQFTQIDPADAAFINPNTVNGLSYPKQLPGGKLVPEAVKVVISSGITLHDYKGLTSTLRLRYFGPRDLTSDGINRSKATLLVNAGAGYQIAERWRISADLLNLFNRRNDDITYAYISRITPTASASFTNVFHPAEPLQVRFWLERTF